MAQTARAAEALWDGPGRRWLEKLELPDVEREIVDDLCALLDALQPIVARVERELRARAKPDPRVTALRAFLAWACSRR